MLRIAALALLTLLPQTLPGQSEAAAWKPTLGEAFPLALKEGRVVFTESVLVAPNLILPAGTLARNIFPVPDAKAVAASDRLQKRKDFEERYGSRRTDISAVDPENDPRMNYERAVQNLASAEPWTRVEKFAAFLQAAPADSYLFAYQSSVDAPPAVAQFRFPERMLLSEQGGVVTIRAMGVGSSAEQSGIPPGARLLRVGGVDLEGSLKKFVAAYPVEKEKAQLAGTPLALVYLDPGTGETRTAGLRVPVSLKSNAGLFNDIPLDSKPKAASEAGAPQVETSPNPSP